MRLLDLYGGLGGTARGIQSVLEKKGIKFEYIAIEHNLKVAEAHRRNNPKSKVIVADALTWLQDVKNYDFVWASPPCKTHSKWNMVWSSRRKNHPKPDPTLWFLIREFRALGINFVVENVDPYYKDPCDPTIKIGRHQFWTSFPIKKFDFISREKPFDQMTTRDWQQYHQLETIEGKAAQKRQALRNCTHWSIAAKIFEQFLEPKILSIKHFLQKEDLNK